MKIRVYYEDTDCGGVVYHSKYLNFCERARSELFFTNGLSPVTDEGHFLVKSMNCQFIKPALLGDELTIRTENMSFKKASLSIIQKIYRGEALIFEADVVLVFLNNNKITCIPENTLTLLKENIS